MMDFEGQLPLHTLVDPAKVTVILTTRKDLPEDCVGFRVTCTPTDERWIMRSSSAELLAAFRGSHRSCNSYLTQGPSHVTITIRLETDGEPDLDLLKTFARMFHHGCHTN